MISESRNEKQSQNSSNNEPLLVLQTPSPFVSSKPKGFLVIIGGGEIPNSILQKILDLSSQPSPRFVILPMASETPLETASVQKQRFEQLGASNVDIVNLMENNKDSEENLNKLHHATGIFFCGGDQRKLTSALLGTKLLREIRNIYERGGVVAGTSAGAAVMSKLMLTGESRVPLDPASPFYLIQSKNVQTSEGFGFLDNIIIDQHFSRRGRHNRLLSLVLEHPQLLGIGIDEETAIIVSPDQMLEVSGNSHIFIFDASLAHHIRVNDQQNMSASHIQLHLLCAQERYDLNERKFLSALSL